MIVYPNQQESQYQSIFLSLKAQIGIKDVPFDKDLKNRSILSISQKLHD